MAIQFFGQFLLGRGIIDEEQLSRAIELQEDLRVRGEERIYIGEALVRLHFVDPMTLDRELYVFMADQAKYVRDSIEIPGELPDPPRLLRLLELTVEQLRQRWSVYSKFGLPQANLGELDLPGIAVEVRFSGEAELNFLLGVPPEVGARGVLEGQHEAGTPAHAALEDMVIDLAGHIASDMVSWLGEQGVTANAAAPVQIAPQRHLDAPERAIALDLVSVWGTVRAAATYRPSSES